LFPRVSKKKKENNFLCLYYKMTTTLTLVGWDEDGVLTKITWENEQKEHRWDCCEIIEGEWDIPTNVGEMSTYFPTPHDEWRTFNNSERFTNAIPYEFRVGYLVGYSTWTEYYAAQPEGYKKFNGFSHHEYIPYWMDLGQGRLADRSDRPIGYEGGVYNINCHDAARGTRSSAAPPTNTIIPEEIVSEDDAPAVDAPAVHFFDRPGAGQVAAAVSARSPSQMAGGGNTKRKSSIKRKATRRMSKKRRVSKHKVTKRRKTKRKNTRRRRR
jgi:hypothetical protein